MQETPPEPYPGAGTPSALTATTARDALRHASDAIFGIDRAGRVSFWNDGAQRLFGWLAHEIIGQPASVLLPPDRIDEFDRVVHTLLGSADLAAMETYRVHKSGKILPVSCRLSPLLDEQGRVYGATAVVRDNSREVALRRQLEQARELAELRFNGSAVAQASTDVNGRFIAVNPRMCELLGYSERQLLGRGVLEFMDVEDLPEAQDRIQRLAAGEVGRSRHRKRLRHASGRLLDTQVSLLAVTDSDGRVHGLEAVIEDVTDMVAAQRALAENEARWQSLALHSADVAFLTDQDAVIQFASASVAGKFGYGPDEIVGADGFAFVHPEDEPAVRTAWYSAVADPRQPATFEARVRHADGSWRWVEATVSNRMHVPGIATMVTNIIDITERRNAESVLQELAGRDALTGLLTRAPLIAAIDAALTTDAGRTVALVLLDLDRFKVVNVTHGHLVGDDVLIAVAERLRRHSDDVRAVARLGGDRFAVLLDAHLSPARLVRRVQALQAVLTEATRSSELELEVSATAGAVHGPADDSASLLTAAEAALQEAKGRGSGSLVVGSARSTSTAVERALLVEDLRRALAADEFVVHFQPVVSVATGRVVGAEALVRWQHPTRGLLGPAGFIGAAEDSGLIVDIGQRVLRDACEAAATWSGRGPAGAPFHVAVNLSARQLASPDVVDVVRDCLRRSGALPQHLTLEVTESAVMADIEATGRTLQGLRDLGLSIAVDDFGTGYSSLTYLKRFPVTCVKIDRSFVGGLGRDNQDAAIVASVINLARSMGLDCVAEGVETEEQRIVLQALGCELGQGYLWSPALDADAFESWLVRSAAQSPAAALPRRTLEALEQALQEPSVDLGRAEEMLAGGASLHTVAAALNAEGLRTSTGRRWSARAVAQAIAIAPVGRAAGPPGPR